MPTGKKEHISIKIIGVLFNDRAITDCISLILLVDIHSYDKLLKLQIKSN